MDKDDLRLIAGTVTWVLWLVAAVYGFFTHDYQALQLSTPVVLVIAGYLFGAEIVRRVRNGNGNGNA